MAITEQLLLMFSALGTLTAGCYFCRVSRPHLLNMAIKNAGKPAFLRTLLQPGCSFAELINGRDLSDHPCRGHDRVPALRQ